MEPISRPYPVAENVSVVSLVLTSKADEFSGACNSGSFLTGPLKPPVESADMKGKNKMSAPVRLRKLQTIHCYNTKLQNAECYLAHFDLNQPYILYI